MTMVSIPEIREEKFDFVSSLKNVSTLMKLEKDETGDLYLILDVIASVLKLSESEIEKVENIPLTDVRNIITRLILCAEGYDNDEIAEIVELGDKSIELEKTKNKAEIAELIKSEREAISKLEEELFNEIEEVLEEEEGEE